MTAAWPRALPAMLLAGCGWHVPPPADLGPPLPPAALEQHGIEVALSEHFLASLPVATGLRGAGALPLGEGPLALELGGNLGGGGGWIGATPALHWAPPPRAGSPWRFGGRLGLVAGTGDALGDRPFADPYAGASVLGQVSHTWGAVGGVTAALGWGITGYLRCPLGCAFDDPDEDEPEDPNQTWPDRTFRPYNGPALHLRTDLPLGRRGAAVLLGASAQPAVWSGDVGWLWSLSAGLHGRRVEP